MATLVGEELLFLGDERLPSLDIEPATAQSEPRRQDRLSSVVIGRRVASA